jgi:hypothetical protein
MSPQLTVGIISPGDMGHAIGAVLRQHGLRVLTNLQGRSARTVALAVQAGMTDVDDDETPSDVGGSGGPIPPGRADGVGRRDR